MINIFYRAYRRLAFKSSRRLYKTNDHDDFPYEVSYFEGTDIKSTSFGGMNALNKNVRLIGDISIGMYSTVGEGSHLNGKMTIGNYCQIGPRVCVQAKDHNIGVLSIHNGREFMDGKLKRLIVENKISIGHGVYIGYGAIILKGVSIGNGAVIGAGSVVTKDIPNYAVAVGNPAKVIRFRFDEEISQIIESSKWWMLSSEHLNQHIRLFEIDINKERNTFLECISALKP